MAVSKHPTGAFRAYKQINSIVYQFYSFDECEAQAKQIKLEQKSYLYKNLKSPRLFSSCGRLVGLRVRTYKKTNKATFQLQISVNGKQVKTEHKFKNSFETMWATFFTLWCNHFALSPRDRIDYKEQIIKAKRLYMQDVFHLQNTVEENH